MQPARLHLLPFADKWGWEPSPSVVGLHVGIDLLLVGDHHREEEAGQIATVGGIVPASFEGLVGHHDVGTTDDPRSAVDEHVLPEHEGTVRHRFGVILFDGNAILVDVLGLPRLRIDGRHPDERGLATPLAIGDEGTLNVCRGEVRREEGIVCRFLTLAEGFRAVAHVPTIHLQRVTASAVVLLGDFESGEPGLLPIAGRVDKLGGRRLGDETEDKRHHRFPLRVIERELGHPITLVVALVLSLLVVVAPRRPELLPEEALALVGEELFQEETGVGVDRLRRDMGFLDRGVRQIRVETVDDGGLFGVSVSIAVVGALVP